MTNEVSVRADYLRLSQKASKVAREDGEAPRRSISRDLHE